MRRACYSRKPINKGEQAQDETDNNESEDGDTSQVINTDCGGFIHLFSQQEKYELACLLA